MFIFNLPTVNGQLPTADKMFSWVAGIAIRNLVSTNNEPEDPAYRLSPQFITKAYDKLKNQKIVNTHNGQQLQEFFISSILQKFFEVCRPENTFLTATPGNEETDSVILELSGRMSPVVNGDKLTRDNAIIHNLQLKEIREEGELFKVLSESLKDGPKNLLETAAFKKSIANFKEVWINKYDPTTELVIFLRGTPNVHYRLKEISEVFQTTNAGHFKKIWFITPTSEVAINEPSPTTPPWRYVKFIVHNLLESTDSCFHAVSMNLHANLQ